MSGGTGGGELHVLRTTLIVALSVAMVLLGANDLHKKHFSKVASQVRDPKELIRELRGDPDLKQLINNGDSLGAVKKARSEKEAKVEHSDMLKKSVEKLVP